MNFPLLFRKNDSTSKEREISESGSSFYNQHSLKDEQGRADAKMQTAWAHPIVVHIEEFLGQNLQLNSLRCINEAAKVFSWRAENVKTS